MAASDMLTAALAYAARGWPVFPCHPESKRPLVAALRGEPKGSGGLKRATTNQDLIRQWWKKWPKAMIGAPTGDGIGAFVVDLDAGTDPDTGEVFEAEALIAALQAEIGEELPETETSETPRGGRHLFFRHHEGIGNRAGIISRVDVRGDGGYVVVPPSARADGNAYRWLVEPDTTAAFAAAPAALVDLVLRRGKWGPANRTKAAPARPPAAGADDARRRYAVAAFDEEVRRLANAPKGERNATINEVAFKLGQLVGAGALTEAVVRGALENIVDGWPNARKSRATIDNGLTAGKAEPRDLSAVTSRARHQSAGLAPGGGLGGALPPRGADGRSPDRDASREAMPSDQMEMRDILRQRRRREDPPPIEPRGGARAGQWTPNRLGLPSEDPCPVVPLGFDGDNLYLLNTSGQLIGWTEQRFTHAGIQKLFAATPNWPEWAYPRYGRAKKVANPDGTETTIIPVESFKDDEVRKGLFRAVDRKGMFAPEHKVRGRGAWKMADGALYYHAGEELWIVEGGRVRAIETGIVDDGGQDVVFPRMASLPPPWPKPITPEDNPARALIEGFRRWNWERPDIDPVLLLGWIGVAFLGGALDWRSAVFLIGDKGTGKSTLQEAIKHIFGDALLDSANTTAAGIYQALGHDARPVAIDEMEGDDDNRRSQQVIELARQASSGAFGRRGASDSRAHGVEFQMRSAFLFSAINNPPLLPQDLSRLAMLRLRELGADRSEDAPITIDIETAGRKVLAQLMLNWHRWPATLAAYRAALAAGGHTGRGQDTYGTLLAAADMIIGPELAEELGIPMVDNVDRWSDLLSAESLPEVQDALPNWRACINHLLQNRVPVWRSGERATVGQLLDDLRDKDSDLTAAYAKRQLAQAGLGLAHEADSGRGWLLAVPNQSPLLEALFYGSRWQGAPGAGGWSEALRQGPKDTCLHEAKGNRVRINGVQQRCTLVALDNLDKGGLDKAKPE